MGEAGPGEDQVTKSDYSCASAYFKWIWTHTYCHNWFDEGVNSKKSVKKLIWSRSSRVFRKYSGVLIACRNMYNSHKTVVSSLFVRLVVYVRVCLFFSQILSFCQSNDQLLWKSASHDTLVTIQIVKYRYDLTEWGRFLMSIFTLTHLCLNV